MESDLQLFGADFRISF